MTSSEDQSSPYDYRSHKIVAVLSKELEAGIALNVLGHLSIAFGHASPSSLMGRPILLDASGIPHRGIAKFPFMITQAKRNHIRKAIQLAKANPDLYVGDYPKEMLETGHDDELVAAIALRPETDIEYLGALISGPPDAVDAITGKYSLWR